LITVDRAAPRPALRGGVGIVTTETHVARHSPVESTEPGTVTPPVRLVSWLSRAWPRGRLSAQRPARQVAQQVRREEERRSLGR